MLWYFTISREIFSLCPYELIQATESYMELAGTLGLITNSATSCCPEKESESQKVKWLLQSQSAAEPGLEPKA